MTSATRPHHPRVRMALAGSYAGPFSRSVNRYSSSRRCGGPGQIATPVPLGDLPHSITICRPWRDQRPGEIQRDTLAPVSRQAGDKTGGNFTQTNPHLLCPSSPMNLARKSKHDVPEKKEITPDERRSSE